MTCTWAYWIFIAPPENVPGGVKLPDVKQDKQRQSNHYPRGPTPPLKHSLKGGQNSPIQVNHAQFKEMTQLILYHPRDWCESMPRGLSVIDSCHTQRFIAAELPSNKQKTKTSIEFQAISYEGILKKLVFRPKLGYKNFSPLYTLGQFERKPRLDSYSHTLHLMNMWCSHWCKTKCLTCYLVNNMQLWLLNAIPTHPFSVLEPDVHMLVWNHSKWHSKLDRWGNAGIVQLSATLTVPEQW